MHVDPREVALADVSDIVRRSFQPMADEKGLQFDIELDADAPSAIRTDSQRLHQVLKNLLANAFKFTDSGSVKLHIGPAEEGTVFERDILREASNVIAFSVADSGIGIPRTKLKLIFEAFQQADGTTSRRYGGTGLGLSISREIARLLGGEIHVSSEPGEGSVFTLFLPERYVAPPNAEPAEELDGAAPQLALDKLRMPSDEEVQGDGPHSPIRLFDDREDIHPGDRVLLVIEDDQPFASILLSAGHERGFKVLCASRGDEGLALARSFGPDAVTLDIGLPGLDGWTVLDQLKRDPQTRHIPVQVISAADGGNRAANLGAFAHLAKPVSREAIGSALAQMHAFVDRPIKSLLVVEDEAAQRRWIVDLLGGDDVDITSVASGAEALRVLDEKEIDCLVFDLALPDADGLTLLETIRSNPKHKDVPIVVYTARDISPKEQRRLQALAGSIITKSTPQSPEQLLHDTALFLHRLQRNSRSRLDASAETTTAAAEDATRTPDAEKHDDASLAGRHVLVVDDDVRNIFAITSALESHGVIVEFAENGRDAIAMLDRGKQFDAILMDLMMPEMDGYQTIEAIRKDQRFERVPIIAVTAKAHNADREKCLAAGASDYLPKPVDIDQLIALLRRRVSA